MNPLFPPLIAVIGTLIGVIVGGAINYRASQRVKNHEWRLALLRDRISTRQKLYAEFLDEAQRLAVQGSENKMTDLSDMNMVNGKFAEISLVAPANVIEAAEKLAGSSLTSHSALTSTEVREFAKFRSDFIAVARADIQQMGEFSIS